MASRMGSDSPRSANGRAPAPLRQASSAAGDALRPGVFCGLGGRRRLRPLGEGSAPARPAPSGAASASGAGCAGSSDDWAQGPQGRGSVSSMCELVSAGADVVSFNKGFRSLTRVPACCSPAKGAAGAGRAASAACAGYLQQAQKSRKSRRRGGATFRVARRVGRDPGRASDAACRPAAAYRGLRADRRLQHHGPGGPQRLGRLAVPAADRQRRLLRRPARLVGQRPLAHRPGRRPTSRRPGATAMAAWCWRPCSPRRTAASP